jgi:KUP system potassium uptake protein
MVATIALVLGFGESSRLAAAYGVAVTTTMVITTLLLYVAARRLWHWPRPLAALVAGVFLAVDCAFFGANIVKVAQGGWVPLLIAAAVFTLMTTWKRGRDLLGERLQKGTLPVEEFVRDVERRAPTRVAGSAVFLTSDPRGTPIALLHNIKHNKVLHEQVIFLTVVNEEVPHVPAAERLRVEPLGAGFYRVVARYGFMQDAHVPRVLGRAGEHGLSLDPRLATYFLSRNTLLPARRPAMPRWRELLFIVMARNAARPTQFFRIPPNRVVELGMQVEL